jgi:DNA-directed RNA polymerase subunit RPC12/RpoP
MNISDIQCPSCGAPVDATCIFDTEAFCMECGDVFTIDNKANFVVM